MLLRRRKGLHQHSGAALRNHVALFLLRMHQCLSSAAAFLCLSRRAVYSPSPSLLCARFTVFQPPQQEEKNLGEWGCPPREKDDWQVCSDIPPIEASGKVKCTMLGFFPFPHEDGAAAGDQAEWEAAERRRSDAVHKQVYLLLAWKTRCEGFEIQFLGKLYYLYF